MRIWGLRHGIAARRSIQNRVDPIHFCLSEADFGQAKQSQSSQRDCRASLAMTSHSKKKGGQLYAAPFLTLCPFPPLPVWAISPLPAPGISLPISLRFLSYSPATKRKHYAAVKVLRSLWYCIARIEGSTCHVAAERLEERTRYAVDQIVQPVGQTQGCSKAAQYAPHQTQAPS